MKIDIIRILSIIEESIIGFNHPLKDFFKNRKKNNLHFLIAIMLSSRTKDETTVKVCKRLFLRVKNVRDLEKIAQKDIEQLIYPVGFYKTKARHLKFIAIILKNEFNGFIPDNIENLLKLPGVGRKTANLFISLAFLKPGICVDVHVHRILNRIGYLNTKNPLETEMYLRENLNKRYWNKINELLVVYGQNICRPVSPKCEMCKINKYCSYFKSIDGD